MRERPIIFSAPMVRAILDGRKTQTRRVVKPQPSSELLADFAAIRAMRGSNRTDAQMLSDCLSCPYGAPGDQLWLKEAFSGPWCMEAQGGMAATPPSKWGATSRIWYWADGSPTHGDWTRPRPSIHMPRWASRITLEIESVRVERLQDISEADAEAEGCEANPYPGPWWQGYRDVGNGRLIHQQSIGETPPEWMIEPKRMYDHKHLDMSAVDAYRALWFQINGLDSWKANPWVWVVSFRRITP